GIACIESNHQSVNVTVAINQGTPDVSHGVYIENTNVTAHYTNSIFWHNIASHAPPDFTWNILDVNNNSMVEYSDIGDDAVGGTIPFGGATNNNIDDDPLFVAEPAEDFHLQSASILLFVAPPNG